MAVAFCLPGHGPSMSREAPVKDVLVWSPFYHPTISLWNCGVNGLPYIAEKNYLWEPHNLSLTFLFEVQPPTLPILSLCHIITNYVNDHTWGITHEKSHCIFRHDKTHQELSLAGVAGPTTGTKTCLLERTLLWRWLWLLLLCPSYIGKGEHCFCFVFSKGKSASTVWIAFMSSWYDRGPMKTHSCLLLARGMYIRKGRATYW